MNKYLDILAYVSCLVGVVQLDSYNVYSLLSPFTLSVYIPLPLSRWIRRNIPRQRLSPLRPHNQHLAPNTPHNLLTTPLPPPLPLRHSPPKLKLRLRIRRLRRILPLRPLPLQLHHIPLVTPPLRRTMPPRTLPSDMRRLERINGTLRRARWYAAP